METAGADLDTDRMTRFIVEDPVALEADGVLTEASSFEYGGSSVSFSIMVLRIGQPVGMRRIRFLEPDEAVDHENLE